MKQLRRFCLAALITVSLCIPAWAGPMDTPVPIPPPPPTAPGQGPAATTQVTAPDSMLETLLSVLQSIHLIF